MVLGQARDPIWRPSPSLLSLVLTAPVQRRKSAVAGTPQERTREAIFLSFFFLTSSLHFPQCGSFRGGWISKSAVFWTRQIEQ